MSDRHGVVQENSFTRYSGFGRFIVSWKLSVVASRPIFIKLWMNFLKRWTKHINMAYSGSRKRNEDMHVGCSNASLLPFAHFASMCLPRSLPFGPTPGNFLMARGHRRTSGSFRSSTGLWSSSISYQPKSPTRARQGRYGLYLWKQTFFPIRNEG